MSTAELLAAKRPTPDSWWSWARVDSLAPLRVVLDGETVALPITPEDHVGGLVVGNRVRMHFHYGRAYVTSKAGGPALPGRLAASNSLGPGNDPNTITDTGFYSGYSWAGSLAGYGIGTLLVQQYSADWITQVLTPVDTLNRTLMRVRHSGTTWSAWQQIGAGQWTTLASPTITGLTLGNGLASVRYNIVGNTAEVHSVITVGSTTTMGSPSVALPWYWVELTPGTVFLVRAGVNTYLGFGFGSANKISSYALGGTPAGATLLTASVPFPWVPGDQIITHVRGEIT